MLANAAFGACSIVAAWTIVEGATAIPRLPARTPVHFDRKGRAAGFGPRWSLVAAFGPLAFALCAVSASDGGSRAAWAWAVVAA